MESEKGRKRRAASERLPMHDPRRLGVCQARGGHHVPGVGCRSKRGCGEEMSARKREQRTAGEGKRVARNSRLVVQSLSLPLPSSSALPRSRSTTSTPTRPLESSPLSLQACRSMRLPLRLLRDTESSVASDDPSQTPSRLLDLRIFSCGEMISFTFHSSWTTVMLGERCERGSSGMASRSGSQG